MSAFYAHQDRDFSIGVGAADFRGCGAEGEIFRMRADHLADGVDLIERALHRFGAGDRARHPDGKENRAEAAFAHARDVDAAVGVTDADVEAGVRRRWVVSSCVSTTMLSKCSFFARGVTSRMVNFDINSDPPRSNAHVAAISRWTDQISPRNRKR